MSHSSSLSLGGVRPRLARLALLIFAACAFAAPAAAVTHHVDVLLDLDNSAATGCSVATSDGPFDGVEQILRSVVETEALPTPSATVVEVVRLECGGGSTFDAPILVDDGDWPVGIGLGDSASDVIETYFPADALPPGVDTVRLGVTIRTLGSGNEDALLVTEQGQPILISLADILEIPTLSEWGLILLAALLAFAAAWRLRRQAAVAALVAILVLGGAGVAWATTLLDGNPSDWQFGTKRAGTPPAACTGLRIASLYAKSESGQLCLRIDACLEFNTAPVALDDAFTTPEDTPVAGNVLADNGGGADSDADGDPLTVDTTPITAPTNGGVVLAANGDFTYTPNADFAGTDSFEYRIDDGNGGSDVGLVTITVTAVNDQPVVNPAAFSVSEDATVGTAVGTVTFSDPDAGQSHAFAITAGNTGGAFAIDPGTGQITVAAALDFETLNSYSLTVEVTDDGAPALTGSSTVTITVTDVDDAPQAVDDAATVTEDDPATTVDVLANDTDTDGGPISIQSVTQPANGTVAITNAGADLTYTPNADYCNDPPGTSPDTFTYTLAPGGSTATVSVTVTCEDDAPVAVDDAATFTEDDPATTIDVLANDTDVDAGPIGITSVTQPTNGTVVITNAGADLTYQPNADYCNSPPGTALDTFTYTLTPGGSTATVSVTVTCEDDAPTAVADAATVAEDSGANTIDVQANDTDVDGGSNTIGAVTQPANGTVAITNAGADLSYTPNANYCNDPPGTTLDTFTYTLSPGGSSTTVTVTVTCVDDAPVATADAATVGEDSGANTVNVLANDVDLDGGPISVVAVTQPANGSVAITNGGADLAYTPNANYCNTPPGTTPDTFSYTLNGGSAASVTVAVTCVNDGPVVDLDADDDKGTAGNDFAATFTEATAATLIIDPDDPTGATITDVDDATLASLTVTITNLLDTGEETLSADVTGTSIVANYTPATGVLTLSGPDTLANFVTVLRTVRYHNASLDPDTTPRVVHFVANDGTANGNTAVSTVTVVAVDTAPTAVDDAATVNEDSGANALDVLANDTDPDGGAISVTSVTQPTNGTVAITGGGTGVSYTPNADYCNGGSPLDTFTYTLAPGGSTATVSVTVTCVDDDPTAVADAATVGEDSGANAIDVLANDTDPDGGAISVGSVTQPANGTVAITGGGTGVSYTPNANYCNSPPGTTLDTFTYTLTPGGSSTTVTVTVTCVDDDPVAVADAATVVEDSGANAIDVLTNDTDVDGGAISVTAVTQPANGTAAITGGGTGVSYTPNANYCNNPPGTTLDTFTYSLTPGGSSTTVTVTVTCVDDPPTAVADAATVIEDSGANTIDVQANDTDVDGGANTITAVTQPANGSVAITNGGADLSYTPNANYCNDPPGTTLESFTYTLTPGGSSTSVTVTVTCVNDPPVAGADAFDFIGNTELRVDHGATATPHALETTTGGTGVLENDSDPVEGDPISIVGLTVGACIDNSAPFVCADPAVGRVEIDADGSFSFQPAPGDAGATETFQYTLSDGTDTTVGTVTLTRFERVWYVQNDAAAGGDGTSETPFDAITAANLNDNDSDGDLVDDLDQANDYIFVYFGDGTDGDLSGGLFLEGGQHLIGHHAGLTLPFGINGNGSTTHLVDAVPGNRPLLDDNVADGFDGVVARNVVPAEIVGMNLAGDTNAIDWTTTAAFAGTGTFSMRDNVIRSAGGEGADLNLAGTGGVVLAFHDNVLTATGTAFDLQETGTGSVTISAFDDNVVNGNTGGSGIVINNAVFDSVPGGGLNTVDGGTTAIGASGNGVGGAGLALGNVQGDLHFTGNLSVFADAGAGLTVTGTGAGMQVRVNTGGAATGIVEATGGPAVDANAVGFDLRLTSLKSTNSASTGVSLTNVTGTFSAESSSSVTNATGTDFAISGGTANVTYKGTITDDVGQLVSVSGATGGTKSFEGAITDGDDGDGSGVSLSSNGGATIRFSGGLVLSTGGNAAFAATGGGTVAVCDENPCNAAATGALINKITTTTGTALNVANTTIGAQNLEFRSISSNGGANRGIVLNTTGGSGGLVVKGNGGTCSSAASCTGGAIQNKTVDGISLTSTKASFTRMFIDNNDDSGISGDDVTDFTLADSVVSNNSDTTGGSEAGIRMQEMFGTASITNTTITNNHYDNVRITPASGTLTSLTVSGNTIGPNDATVGNNGFMFAASGAAVATVNLSGTTFNNNRASQLLLQHTGSGTLTSNVTGNNFNDGNIAIDILPANTADMNIVVSGNTMIGADSNTINFSSASTSTNASDIRLKIDNNQIGNGTADSGSRDAFGIAVDAIGDVDMILQITNNWVRNTDFDGIFVESAFDDLDADAEVALLDLTIRDNTVGTPDDNSAFPFGFTYGMRVEARHTSSLCMNMGGNTSASVGGAEHIRVRQRNTATFRVERLTDGDATPNEVITNLTTVENHLIAENDPGTTVDATAQTVGVTGFTEAVNGQCRTTGL